MAQDMGPSWVKRTASSPGCVPFWAISGWWRRPPNISGHTYSRCVHCPPLAHPLKTTSFVQLPHDPLCSCLSGLSPEGMIASLEAEKTSELLRGGEGRTRISNAMARAGQADDGKVALTPGGCWRSCQSRPCRQGGLA